MTSYLSSSGFFSIKYWALACLILQNTFLVLCMRYSREHPHVDSESGEKILYASSSAVFIMEIVKLISCIIVIYVQSSSFSSFTQEMYTELIINRLQIVYVAIPSILYTLQNNLLYFALTHLDATTYQVCYQVQYIIYHFVESLIVITCLLVLT